MEDLTVGEHPTNVYWAVSGDSGVRSEHLDKFHACGIRAKCHNGRVWVLENLKFLRPFDTVQPHHKTLLGYYNNYQVNQKPIGHQGPLPFGTYTIVDYRAMAIVGGDGPRAHWWSEWKDDVLYVYQGEEVKTYRPYLKEDQDSSSNKSRKVKSDDVPKLDPTPNPKQEDSGSESDDPDAPDIFGLFD